MQWFRCLDQHDDMAVRVGRTGGVLGMAKDLIWAAMPRGHWSFFLEPVPAVLVILVAVAIREVWARRLAPSMTST